METKPGKAHAVFVTLLILAGLFVIWAYIAATKAGTVGP
jgi:hypothetical protein